MVVLFPCLVSVVPLVVAGELCELLPFFALCEPLEIREERTDPLLVDPSVFVPHYSFANHKRSLDNPTLLFR